MVAKRFVTEQNFRELAFANAALLHTRRTTRASSRLLLSSKRLPINWAWKEHRGLRARRRLTSRVMGREHAGRQPSTDDR